MILVLTHFEKPTVGMDVTKPITRAMSQLDSQGKPFTWFSPFTSELLTNLIFQKKKNLIRQLLKRNPLAKKI